jgi:hypothetical protein
MNSKLLEQSSYEKNCCWFVLLALISYTPGKKKPVIVWQPSHQTNTGKDFNEATVSNAIGEAAMATKPIQRIQSMEPWTEGCAQCRQRQQYRDCTYNRGG